MVENNGGKIIYLEDVRNRVDTIATIIAFSDRFKLHFRTFLNWCNDHGLSKRSDIEDTDANTQLLYLYMFLQDFVKLLEDRLDAMNIKNPAHKLIDDIRSHTKERIFQEAILHRENQKFQVMFSEYLAAAADKSRDADEAELKFMLEAENRLRNLILQFQKQCENK